MAKSIDFKLMDAEDMQSDEIAGSLSFDTKDLIENEHGHGGMFRWKNIYGSPLGLSGSNYKRLMNTIPDHASTWKGRVLVQAIAEPTDKPLLKVQMIENEIVAEA